MVIAGYIASVLIGISLGLIGGGGSILTVPVLVYLMHIDPVLATTYSLFVVGSCSLVGGIKSYRKQQVHFPTVLIFGSSSLLAIFLVRHFLLPCLPQHIAVFGSRELTKGVFLMLLFAALMIVASVFMIRSGKQTRLMAVKEGERKIVPLLLQGTLVGTITGLLGAGGGFLIIPALVLFSRLPMKVAVGTSLTIMAFSSLFGFFSSLSHYQVNWWQLLTFTAVAVTGIFIGTALSDKIPGAALKKAFGWFVLSMGMFVLVYELAML